jgi:hypothetical protein
MSAAGLGQRERAGSALVSTALRAGIVPVERCLNISDTGLTLAAQWAGVGPASEISEHSSTGVFW